jgi:hypothetical protein
MSMQDDTRDGADLSPAPQSSGFTAEVRRRFAMFGLVLQLNRLGRHCALDSEVLVSMPRLIDVILLPLERVADKAQQFADEVGAERAEFESHYRDNRKRAIAVAYEIAHNIDVENDHVAYEYACACLRAHRTVAATKILESLALREGPPTKYVSLAKQRVARQAWKAGDLEQALLSMRSLRGRAVRSQYRNWLGISTVRNGLLIAESGNTESAGEVLMGGLMASGMARDVADAVSAIYLAAVSSKPVSIEHELAAVVSGSEDRACEPRPIILSGFGWSGSGAVADFLMGHPHVADIFSGREMGFWTGKYGLDRLYEHFSTRGFNRRLLLEFLTRHCFGHRFIGHSKGTKSLGGLWAMLDEPQRWSLLRALAKWLEGIHAWQNDADHPILETFQSLTSAVLGLLAGRAYARILLSNCVPSDSIVGIRMFRDPAVIVSWRDPGDAYASKTAAFPDNSLDYAGWRRQLTTRIERYLAGKTKVAEYASIWIDVSFEEFVLEEHKRNDLLKLLQLDGEELGSTFDASVSAKNIGILHPRSGNSEAAWLELAGFAKDARREAQALSRQGTG